ncbi:hypothetical protein WT24_29660 [Burkholderia sp. MSMB1078WGS]|nr:hypothetical protein WT24_29660 [Burkholderia sp. MSMB1078WGS]
MPAAAQRLLVGFEGFQNSQRFVTPQKVGDMEGGDVGVHRRGALGLDVNRSARTDMRYLDAPPRRKQIRRFDEVPFAHDKRRLVERSRVGVDLQRKTVQCVGVTFELIPVNDAIDHRDIDPACTVLKPKLFYDEHVGVRQRLCKDLFHDGGSNVAIACCDTRRLIAV